MTPNAIAALAVGLAAMVCATVLTALTGSAPTELWTLASLATGGGLGIAIPTASAKASTPPAPPPAAPTLHSAVIVSPTGTPPTAPMRN